MLIDGEKEELGENDIFWITTSHTTHIPCNENYGM
jgi:hypothetical protein